MLMKSLRYRPTVQRLDARKLMAADLGIEGTAAVDESAERGVILEGQECLVFFLGGVRGTRDAAGGTSNTFAIGERDEPSTDEFFAEIGASDGGDYQLQIRLRQTDKQ